MKSSLLRHLPDLSSVCRFAASSALSILAGQWAGAQEAPTTTTGEVKIGDTPVATILEGLGAKLEHGATTEQLDKYSRLFGFVDRDGDGRHSKREYIDNGNYLTPQARTGIFNAADSDKDGFVSQAEYSLNRIITDEAKTIMQAMDDDNDGLVQQSEFVAHAGSTLADQKLAGKIFDALDTDSNGSLIVPEYLRAWGAWARAGGGTAEERFTASTLAIENSARLVELDAYWTEVSRSVREGDFDGYKATCHTEGVLVSGSSQSSYPLSKALARWQQGFADTKSGKIRASVEFRFGQRLGDATTAHETGMFLYSTIDPDGTPTEAFIHFEALLLKQNEAWKILMEYQKSKGTKEQWEALK